MLRRKQITFDIDTNIAKRIFGTGYRTLYYNLEKHFADNGFIHLQGSVYQSTNAVTDFYVMGLVSIFIYNNPGVEKCIRDLRLTDVIKQNSLNHLCNYDGTTGKYPDKSENKPKQRDDYTR